MRLHYFVDESFAGPYVLAAVGIEPARISSTRARTRRLRVAGSARFHMSRESPPLRSHALAELAAMAAETLVVEVSTRTPARHRRPVAVRTLADALVDRGGSRVVIERDDSRLALDRRTIDAAIRERNARMAYAFLGPTQEPLLWLPDIAAWAWARGGRIRRRPRAVHVIRV